MTATLGLSIQELNLGCVIKETGTEIIAPHKL